MTCGFLRTKAVATRLALLSRRPASPTLLRRRLASACAASDRWEVVVGLEMHAQLNSRTKLFSDALTAYNDQPNWHVSAVDAAFPGALPHPNAECVGLAVRAALALDAAVQPRSTFDRKHYFYHDIPAGYQITQHYEPIARGGELQLSALDGLPYERSVRMVQLQIEQDTGKSMMDASGTQVAVDLNRAGMPLIEIVTQPDIRSSLEAGLVVRKLQAILRAVGASNGNMEEGSLRCDVNVSVRRPGGPFGTRCELKNLTSIRFLTAAIDAEVARQIKLLEAGGTLARETRGYDVSRKQTFSLRSKETAVDYRYMPDPDLPPVYLSPEYIKRERTQLAELPDAQKKRFMDTYGLTLEDCDTLLAEPGVSDYYVQVAEQQDPRVAFNWMTSELMGQLNVHNIRFSDNPVSPTQLQSVVSAVSSGQISGKIAKKVLAAMVKGDQRLADAIVDARGWAQIDDETVLNEVCRQLVAENAEKVAAVVGGNKRLFGWFVGQVMQQTKGKANPVLVNKLLRSLMGLTE
ncbi:aspartyl/glutamyl-tRNA amidotransferase subunit B [Thamnocephalis sphaerospora]|uniref:Glutamyl-tRNA(Gln) amidotransferase subunit B, mitochondrial n=1 Tax=Thamnocephalis sphaerospora TaxID=78915 RepID=A0A4P9XV51_9FUNG|nr:aspartyl/glutamyl-tRNA amidotransferase subunit B [Thamnocephalis sphaerospora]|eukprot:RKP09471.1 aspartyl/glutamyl-tRNA amidotransferase subunit B [Thamnocephalis sphaerospora]